jgi:transposase
MLSIPELARIFVARKPVDFRRQFDGLAAIVQDTFGMDPFGGQLFVFFNKSRDRIKLLVWQHTGFWLFYKRLERGTFDMVLDVDSDDECVEVDARRLRLLLDGVDLKSSKFRRHFAQPLRIGSRRHGGGQRSTA